MRALPDGWSNYWNRRLRGAACKQSPQLGWIDDEPPTRESFEAMCDVCITCPVRLACVEYALDDEAPVLGGMYGGIWVPWKGSHEDDRPGRPGSYTAARNQLRTKRKELLSEQFKAVFTEMEQEKNHA